MTRGILALREVTDDDIEALAAEWAADGQPTLVEVARLALESSDPGRQERARQRCVDAIEARRAKAAPEVTAAEIERERAVAEIKRGKAEVRELVKERGVERDEIAALAQLGVTVSRTEIKQAKAWRLEAPAVRPRPTRSARKAPSQAPAEADPNDVWVPLDRLIRVSLAAYLDAQGFPALATRLRGLAPVTTAVKASALRAVHREFTDAIYVEAFALGDAAAALRSQGADELEVLAARGRAHDPRFRSADTMCGLVVNVAAEFAASTALSPGPWPPPRQYAAMCLREIAYCEQAIERAATARRSP